MQLHIVLGYRCFIDGPLARFLDAVVARADEADVIVTTGGFTAQRSAPGISEAQLMADYLRQAGVSPHKLVVEQAARTTLENFRNTARELERRQIAPRSALVFCDAIRQAKVRMLARNFLPGARVELSLHDFERTALQALVQRTLAVAHDALMLRWSAAERLSLAIAEARQRRR